LARNTTTTPKAEPVPNTPSRPKYPKIHVRLSGQNGNSHNLIALCMRAAREADLPLDRIDAFTAEAHGAESYDAMIQTCMQWFDIH
jgi:predicted secreted protein